jgi:hypothetical protein
MRLSRLAPLVVLTALLLIAGPLFARAGESQRHRRVISGITGYTYTTTFQATENPFSEGGAWINGAKTGKDWKDIQTVPGQAYGPTNFATSHYDDATAVLAGTWSADQEVEAKVFSSNQLSGSDYEEVEIRLRTTIRPNSITGYEILWRVNHDGSQYHQIGRWLGPIGVSGGCALHCAFEAAPNSLHPGDAENGMQAGDGLPGISNGDVVRARIVGTTITTYINDAQMESFTDTMYATGSPGIGHWYHATSGSPTDFGFTRVTVRGL